MTYLFPVAQLTASNEPLWNSPADSISPALTTLWVKAGGPPNPPANDGKKVVLLDTDHFSPFSSNALWVWKAFLSNIDLVRPGHPWRWHAG